jgi:site-specific recombinase XerD
MSEHSEPQSGYTATIAPTEDGGGRTPDLSPPEAAGRWLDRLRARRAESTVATYDYRLKLFLEWCEEEGVTSVRELTGWDIDEYERHRRAEGVKNVSLNNELGTLKNFLEYCAQIEVVDEELPEKVEPPEVSAEEDVDDTKLAVEDAKRLFQYYGQSETDRYSRAHALLTLAWFGGPPRLGAIRALDLSHYNSEEQYLRYHHTPDDDTPLKKQRDGERAVGLPEEACEVLDGYIKHDRNDVRDEYGREPLLTSRDGRASRNAIRAWMYLATVPCLHSACPHGMDPDSCEYLTYSAASKCPSSRSPHQVRTGAITWMRNQGVPAEVVAERANTSVSVIERHYDKPEHVEKMEKRRRPYLDDLRFVESGGDSG